MSRGSGSVSEPTGVVVGDVTSVTGNTLVKGSPTRMTGSALKLKKMSSNRNLSKYVKEKILRTGNILLVSSFLLLLAFIQGYVVTFTNYVYSDFGFPVFFFQQGLTWIELFMSSSIILILHILYKT